MLAHDNFGLKLHEMKVSSNPIAHIRLGCELLILLQSRELADKGQEVVKSDLPLWSKSLMLLRRLIERRQSYWP